MAKASLKYLECFNKSLSGIAMLLGFRIFCMVCFSIAVDVLFCVVWFVDF